jgi:hypothetical protein
MGVISVVKHQETHPNLDVDGCFGCKIAYVGIGADAMPSRGGKARVATINDKDRVLDKDLDAYQRLRRNGVQPRKIDGAAKVEKRAEEKWQVETGILPNT